MKMKRAYWLRTALLALLGFLSFAPLQAGGGREIELQAMLSESDATLYVEWIVYGETQPVKFELYQKDGFTKEYSELAFLTELTPDSTQSYEGEGYYVTAYMDKLSYTDTNTATFYIKAIYADGTIKQSDFTYISPWHYEEPDYIIFKSEPTLKAKIGVEYKYEVKAEAQSGKEIRYMLEGHPEGAVIDEVSGKISWTPNAYGRYNFEVYATTIDDEYNQNGNYQFWTVTVQKCDKLSKISGEVKDQYGNKLEYGFVEIVIETDSLGYYEPYGYSEIHNGKYEIKDVDEGDYTLVVYVKDFYGREPVRVPVHVGCDENKKVDIEITAPDMNNKITINSIPEDHIKLGQTYTYDVNASAPNANLNIHYQIMQAPEGTTIDEQTGILTWTADASGQQAFMVQAWAQENEGSELLNDYQGWSVNVMECDVPAKLDVTVKFDDDKPLPTGWAYLFTKVEKDTLYFLMSVQSAPVEHGQAIFENLDKGTYYLMVDDFTDGGRKDYYYQHWYENAFTVEEATPIVVDCGQELSVNMTLTRPPQPNYYKISGVVTDEDGNPIENAMVEVYDQSGKMRYHESYYQAYTDANGKYEISAADDGHYIAVAYVIPADSAIFGGSFYFMPIYYNQTNDPSEAEHIQLTGDRTDINFVLPEAPHFENSVSGKITDENGAAIPEAYIMLYLIEPSEDYNEWLYFGFVALTKDNGTYTASNLIPGKYVAFTFSPYQNMFVPGYYKEGEPSTLNWEDATLIQVDETSVINDINIQLGTPKGLVGIGRVEGKVTGDEKKQIVKGGNDTGIENPIAGANVYAINEQGDVAGSAQTANDGSFFINGLSKGNYTLTIDKVGYELSNVNITLADDNSKSNAEVNIRNKGLGVSDKQGLASATVAPNPAAETLKLEFVADGPTRIALVNSLGTKVYAVELGSINGASTHSINLGSYPQGSYYAIIESGARASALPVIIIK